MTRAIVDSVVERIAFVEIPVLRGRGRGVRFIEIPLDCMTMDVAEGDVLDLTITRINKPTAGETP